MIVTCWTTLSPCTYLCAGVVRHCERWYKQVASDTLLKTYIGSGASYFGAEVKSRTLRLLPTFQLFGLTDRGRRGWFPRFGFLDMPEAIFHDGESPAGGDNVRRLTFRKTAIVYEAEVSTGNPCFRQLDGASGKRRTMLTNDRWRFVVV